MTAEAPAAHYYQLQTRRRQVESQLETLERRQRLREQERGRVGEATRAHLAKRLRTLKTQRQRHSRHFADAVERARMLSRTWAADVLQQSAAAQNLLDAKNAYLETVKRLAVGWEQSREARAAKVIQRSRDMVDELGRQRVQEERRFREEQEIEQRLFEARMDRQRALHKQEVEKRQRDRQRADFRREEQQQILLANTDADERLQRVNEQPRVSQPLSPHPDAYSASSRRVQRFDDQPRTSQSLSPSPETYTAPSRRKTFRRGDFSLPEAEQRAPPRRDHPASSEYKFREHPTGRSVTLTSAHEQQDEDESPASMDLPPARRQPLSLQTEHEALQRAPKPSRVRSTYNNKSSSSSSPPTSPLSPSEMAAERLRLDPQVRRHRQEIVRAASPRAQSMAGIIGGHHKEPLRRVIHAKDTAEQGNESEDASSCLPCSSSRKDKAKQGSAAVPDSAPALKSNQRDEAHQDPPSRLLRLISGHTNTDLRSVVSPTASASAASAPASAPRRANVSKLQSIVNQDDELEEASPLSEDSDEEQRRRTRAASDDEFAHF